MSSKGPWDKWTDKYFVHDETVEDTLKAIREGFKPLYKQPLPITRREVILDCIVPPGAVPYDGLIQEQIISVPHLQQGVPITVYKPTNLPQDPLIIIYCHGGGLVLGSRGAFDPCMKQMSMTLPAVLVIIGYRLLPCPEDPLAPFNDCVAAAEWILKNKVAVGGHQNSKVAVAGDSAGGQLASCITYSIKSGIDFQVLFYPVTDVKCDTESCKEFYRLPAFATRSMEKIIEFNGTGAEEMAKNPRINPSSRKDLHTCPPTLIMLAPLDPLRDWGIAFADKLRAAGVDVELVIIPGVPHGFFSKVGIYPVKSMEGCNHVKRFLKSKM